MCTSNASPKGHRPGNYNARANRLSIWSSSAARRAILLRFVDVRDGEYTGEDVVQHGG